jgi:hypothetical protein
MSSGGGKGGKKTQETTIPEWLRGPAARNLQRAEAVQQIEYMPYYGPDVAAFTPAQNAAFDANIGAAEAFGLLAPNTLTATSGMPTPTDWDGFSGYSSQPMYESALAELKAKQPGAVAQYDALFGNQVPAINWGGGGGGSRFRGSVGGNPPSQPGSPQPHYLDSGLDDLNNMNFGIDPIQARNQAKQRANFVSAQNRTPTKHAPVRKGKYDAYLQGT